MTAGRLPCLRSAGPCTVTSTPMERVPISRFRTTCSAVIEQVRRTGQPVLTTKRGVPVAQLLPAPAPLTRRSAFGALKGTVEYLGDIVEPLGEEEWEAAR